MFWECSTNVRAPGHDFDKGIVWIKWIDTHQDDDKIGARLRRYFSVFR